MQVSVAIPKDDGFDFDSYITSRVERYKSTNNLRDLSIHELADERKGYRVSFTNRPVDPKGKEHIANNQIDIFEMEGRVVETSYTGCELFDQYYEVVKAAFASLTLKGSLP